jgi:copper chaperone CopZ
METKEVFISGMTCQGCTKTVDSAIRKIEGVEHVDIDLKSGAVVIKSLQLLGHDQLVTALAAYPSYKVLGQVNFLNGFWSDSKIWSRAGFNTLNCLIGCSLGDFGMILFLQYAYPETSMVWQMILATAAGLMTSIMLETFLLHLRESFSLSASFKTALSMSFLSMVAMELAMNTTDFMITGGKAAFGNPGYWFALVIALIAGFMVPLPYNYYKLKKYNKACH